jgi:hypothetical protein
MACGLLNTLAKKCVPAGTGNPQWKQAESKTVSSEDGMTALCMKKT